MISIKETIIKLLRRNPVEKGSRLVNPDGAVVVIINLERRVEELEEALGEIAEFTTPLGQDGGPDYAVTVGTMRYAARAALKEKNDA